MSGSSNAAPRHGPGLDGPLDEIGTSFVRRGGETGYGCNAVEHATARSDEDTPEVHGRRTAGSGVFEPDPVGRKAPLGSRNPSHFERRVSKHLNRITDA